MRGLAACALALCACGEVGLTLQVEADSDVPPLDALRIEAAQDSVLAEQTYLLQGARLPQSVAIVSKGLTRGVVALTVQGLAGGRVEAVAHLEAALQSATAGAKATATLRRLCATGGCGCQPLVCGATANRACGRIDDGCEGRYDCGGCDGGASCERGVCGTACTPKTCEQQGASCGFVLDGCGELLNCGGCDAGWKCGGAGARNQCGPGDCTPSVSCDAGIECGTAPDGCDGVIRCAACAMGECGADGIPNRCPCVRATQCAAGVECGTRPDGCGGMVTCGVCMAPRICGGSGQPGVCGCTPTTSCPPNACGTQPDGCGGSLLCGGCQGGRSCSSLDGGPTRCNCPAGLADCGGSCVDLKNNASHCGACGRTCPGAQPCSQGVCPCVDVTSNSDGHCCPPAWFLAPILGSNSVRCFRGPFDAGTEATALAQCRAETLAGFGRSVSALGSGLGATASAAPGTACGSFLQGRGGSVIDAENGTLANQTTCFSNCTGSSCTCSSCACQFGARGCSQKYFCVMDPLAPRNTGSCSQSGQCPAGNVCTMGACVDAGRGACALDADCTGSMGPCVYRGAGQTGLCQ